VASDAPEYRKTRSFSSAAPDRTLNATSSKLFGEGEGEVHRPCLKTTMPKPASSEEVLNYRFSEGISTREFKVGCRHCAPPPGPACPPAVGCSGPRCKIPACCGLSPRAPWRRPGNWQPPLAGWSPSAPPPQTPTHTAPNASLPPSLSCR
jgi:hypothetical protein